MILVRLVVCITLYTLYTGRGKLALSLESECMYERGIEIDLKRNQSGRARIFEYHPPPSSRASPLITYFNVVTPTIFLVITCVGFMCTHNLVMSNVSIRFASIILMKVVELVNYNKANYTRFKRVHILKINRESITPLTQKVTYIQTKNVTYM